MENKKREYPEIKGILIRKVCEILTSKSKVGTFTNEEMDRVLEESGYISIYVRGFGEYDQANPKELENIILGEINKGKKDFFWKFLENYLHPLRFKRKKGKYKELIKELNNLLKDENIQINEKGIINVLERQEKNDEFSADQVSDQFIIFISHSKKDLKDVNELSKNLENYGFKAFVAHKDITPSSDWVQEIIKNIRDCRVFIAYLTNDFVQSKWCDQEVGIAYGKNKKIIPIMAKDGIKPYGFIMSVQGMRLDKSLSNGKDSIAYTISSDIVDLLLDDLNIKEDARNTIINKISDIKKYSESIAIFRKLEKLEPFTEEEIKKIIIEANKNSQIYKAYKVYDEINKLIEKYSKELKEIPEADELLKKLQKFKR